MIGIGIFDALNVGQWWEYGSAILVAFLTAAAVYSKQRLDDIESKDE